MIRDIDRASLQLACHLTSLHSPGSQLNHSGLRSLQSLHFSTRLPPGWTAFSFESAQPPGPGCNDCNFLSHFARARYVCCPATDTNLFLYLQEVLFEHFYKWLTMDRQSQKQTEQYFYKYSPNHPAPQGITHHPTTNYNFYPSAFYCTLKIEGPLRSI